MTASSLPRAALSARLGPCPEERGLCRKKDVGPVGSARISETRGASVTLNAAEVLSRRVVPRERENPEFRRRQGFGKIPARDLCMVVGERPATPADRAGAMASSATAAREWRRNDLKTLNVRPEAVWPRKPRTPNIWGWRLARAYRMREKMSCKGAPPQAEVTKSLWSTDPASTKAITPGASRAGSCL